jgi:hypothetical protein
MTPFEYLAVLISIVLGLGVTELLAGLQRLAHARERVRFHWLPLAWSGLVFVTLVQWWWAAFGLRHQGEWNFFSFLLVLLVPVLLYLAAALVLPAERHEGRCDLREHYFGIHRLFFGVIAAATLIEAVRALRVPDHQAAALNLSGTLLLGSLCLVRSPRYHALGTILAALLLGAFVVAETLRIT